VLQNYKYAHITTLKCDAKHHKVLVKHPKTVAQNTKNVLTKHPRAFGRMHCLNMKKGVTKHPIFNSDLK